jgi:hypothetical protein
MWEMRRKRRCYWVGMLSLSVYVICRSMKFKLCCFLLDAIKPAPRKIFLFRGRSPCALATVILFCYLYNVEDVSFRRIHEGAAEGVQPLGGARGSRRRNNHLPSPAISIMFILVSWLQCCHRVVLQSTEDAAKTAWNHWENKLV